MPKGVDVEHMNDFPIPAQDISTAAYSGSDLIKEVCWFVDNSREKKPMQAQKRANAFGLYDMSGNVSEWVWDFYSNYPASPPEIFPHPLDACDGCDSRTVRGGSWWHFPVASRTTARVGYQPDYPLLPPAKDSTVGFRIARTAPASGN